MPDEPTIVGRRLAAELSDLEDRVTQRVRVLLAKIGLDGHDRGIRMIAAWLRNAGMEVILLGTHNTPEYVARAAVEEDADVIGLSFQGADHIPLVRMMAEQLRAFGLEDRLFIVGGNIPRNDISLLQDMGVDMVFPSGTPLSACDAFIKERAGRKREGVSR